MTKARSIDRDVFLIVTSAILTLRLSAWTGYGNKKNQGVLQNAIDYLQ